MNQKIDKLIAWSKDTENNVHIRDVESFTRKLLQINQQKSEHLHIIADFDMTLTKYWQNGKRSLSSHGVLEESSVLDETVKRKMRDTYHKFYPIEISHSITIEEKTKAMVEWWTTTHTLLQNAGLTRQDIKNMVIEKPVTFRPLLHEFIELVSERKIPLLVFSAGLADVIETILVNNELWTDDMAIVSNRMIFENDVCVGFQDPLIHALNKNEAGMSENVHAQKVSNRDNVVLMGDSIGDLKMADGIRHDTKLTIGFLNHDVELLLEKYEQNFDVVLVNDTSLEFVIRLISAIE
ncbi:hypothetical protein HDV06_001206 [Boothiomyces sp. JEL0866]|nr:hypothetical protein HDV06_001206 [Boothiomyces sp. JEL0866]